MNKYIWIGPSGYNPEIGAVEAGLELLLSEEKANFLLDRQLIKTFEIKKPIKKSEG